MSLIDKETCAASTLTVSLKPKAKPGPFRKKVTLYTNDPSAPVIEIPIVGEATRSDMVTTVNYHSKLPQ